MTWAAKKRVLCAEVYRATLTSQIATVLNGRNNPVTSLSPRDFLPHHDNAAGRQATILSVQDLATGCIDNFERYVGKAPAIREGLSQNSPLRVISEVYILQASASEVRTSNQALSERTVSRNVTDFQKFVAILLLTQMKHKFGKGGCVLIRKDLRGELAEGPRFKHEESVITQTVSEELMPWTLT